MHLSYRTWQRLLLSLVALLAACSHVALVPPPTAVFRTPPAPTAPALTATRAVAATLAAPPQPPTAVPPTAAPATPRPSPTPVPPPTFASLPAADLAAQAAAAGVPLTVVSPENAGVHGYPANSFVHPLALAVRGDTAYLLDAGRVLALDLSGRAPLAVLLAPGAAVEGVRVMEPLDLALTPTELLVLDRAGDVYARGLAGGGWRVDRADRAERPDSANHYFVAVEGSANGRFLLETNYGYALWYAAAPRDRLWTLPDSRGVDLAALGDSVYVLRQAAEGRAGLLHRYRDTALLPAFRPAVEIAQPRQVAATETAVYVLDQDGRRVLQLDPDSGALQAIWQPPPGTSALWAGGARLIFATRDALVLAGQPETAVWLPPGPTLAGPQPHDPALLAALPPLRLPIGVSLPARDLQLPGAPRHYRLGVHQGIDLYWRRGRPVTAVAAGGVIRATHGYTTPAASAFQFWDDETLRLGYTPEEGLDFYRGRQVWIQHAGGLLSRYAHLDVIAPEVVTGTAVAQGQLVGAVGNSGSPSSLTPGQPDTHVHVDLWLGAHYVGQYLRPVETRGWLEALFGIGAGD